MFLKTHTKAFALSIMLFAIFFINGKGLLFAQSRNSRFDTLGSQYTLQHYTTDNGLEANHISGIIYDTASQLLWVGTQAGLLYFDGNNFVKPATANLSGRVYYLTRSKKDIYVKTISDSVYTIKSNTTTPISKDPLDFHAIGIQNENGLESYIKRISGYPTPNWLSPIVQYDAEPPLESFITKYGYNVYHYNNKTKITADLGRFGQDAILFKMGNIQFVYQIGEGFWIFDKLQEKMQKLAGPAIDTKSTVFWDEGMPYPVMFTKGKLLALHYEQGTVTGQVICSGLNSLPLIEHLQIFPNGQGVSLGTKNGLYNLWLKQARSLTSDVDSAHMLPEYAQMEIAPGKIFTWTGLYNLQDPAPRHATINYEPYAGIFVSSDSIGWYTHNETLFSNQLRTGHIEKIPLLGTRGLNTVFAEQDKKIYIVTKDYILRYKQGVIFDTLKYISNKAPILDQVRFAKFVNTNQLALADDRNLFYYNINTHELRADTNVLNKGVRYIWQYKDWRFIGTYGNGYYIQHDGITQKMPLDKNGYLKYTHCFMPDDLGFCWMTTNHGLFKASIQAILAAFTDNTLPIYYHYFGKNNGIDETEFNGGCQPAALKLSNGFLSFPTMSGLVIVNPKTALMPPSGIIYFDPLMIDGKINNNTTATANIPYDHSTISLGMHAPVWTNKENMYAMYRLLPNQQTWIPFDMAQQSLLQFNSLRKGTYVLQIRILNGFESGQWRISELSFTVLPPWYFTWWATIVWATLCIALMLLIASIWMNSQRKKHKMEKLLAEQKMIALRAQINPHFLQNTFEFLAMRLQSGNSEMMLESLHKVSVYMRKVLEQSDRQVVSLEDEIDFIEEYWTMQKMLHFNSFTYNIEVSKSVDIFDIQLPALLLQPIAENALHYGITKGLDTNLLSLVVEDDTEFVYCHISDRGNHNVKLKIKKDHLSMGKTLTIERMKILYRNHKKKPYIKETPNNMGGLTVTVALPKR